MTKTILITGAASGFGRLVAFDIARRGHRVIATARRTTQLDEIKESARAEGLDIEVEKLDVTEAADRERIFERDIDVLLSNAGTMEAGPIAEQPIELLREMFEVNLFAGIALAQGFTKQFVRKRRGRIVLVSSMGGLWTVPYGAGYCASKHALEAVAEGLRAELAPFGIQVATINPGAFATGFNERGAASMRWYDPARNFTAAESLAGVRQMLEHQYDPRSMANVIVEVVLSEGPRFRNVYPSEAEDHIKRIQQDAWTAMS